MKFDGLFQEFDTCFVVFTQTFLVLYFFSTSSPRAIAVIFFTGILFFFFWIIQILYRCYQYWGKNQDGERKKTVTKSTHKYRQNRWGVELGPQLHVRRRVLPLHLQTVSSPPPSKVSDEYLGSIDCRSYHYADWLVTQLRSLRHHGKV